MSSIYELDGRVPLRQALPFGLQHILAMFVANITPIIILANAVGIDKGISATLIQNCMIIAGIGTLVQLYPIWRIGSRLPIVMGISFTFLSLAIVIASTQGMGTLTFSYTPLTLPPITSVSISVVADSFIKNHRHTHKK